MAGIAGPAWVAARDEPPPMHRRLILHLDVANPHPRVLRDQAVWLCLPMHRTQVQDGGEVRASVEDTVIERDADGHTVLGLRWRSVAPHFTTRVAIDCAVRMRASVREPEDLPTADWRAPEPFIESDDPHVVRLAASLRRAGELASAQAAYEWVARNIRYAGFIAEDLGAAYALRERRGDCTEFACLVAALARAMGLPARRAGGFVLDRDSVVRALDYHDWTEVLADGRWRLVDAQRGKWLEPTQQYVAFRHHRSMSAPRLAGAHRFRVDGELLASM